MILGFGPLELLILVTIGLAICTTVCALSMEAAVLFTPAFLFVFPALLAGFPRIAPNEAIGLAITVEVFGYTSSVSGYWFRRQIDFAVAGRALLLTVPLAILARLASYFVPAQGLLFVFGLLLVALAAILYRAHRHPNAEPAAYTPRLHLLRRQGETKSDGLSLGRLDRWIFGAAGALAGLVGIAIGEISNTLLTVRRRIPVKISTGTSALILHVTILSALAANLLVLQLAPGPFQAEEITIPWRVAAVLAPVVVVGGQLGAKLNHRLPERLLVRALIVMYTLVGVFVLGRTVFH